MVPAGIVNINQLIEINKDKFRFIFLIPPIVPPVIFVSLSPDTALSSANPIYCSGFLKEYYHQRIKI